MARILILGGPASDSAGLGRRVAPMIGVPLTSLPNLATDQDRDAAVARLAGQQQWVIKGDTVAWIHGLLDRATDIVWLDIPLRVRMWRAVRHRLLDPAVSTDAVWRFQFGRESGQADGLTTRADIQGALAGRKSKVI